MPDDIQIPTLTPEQQAEREIFIRKKQIFMASILQAEANGMTSYGPGTEDSFKILLVEFGNTLPTVQGISPVDFLIKTYGYLTIIFSHEFAKAFWGEHMVDEYGLTQEQRAKSNNPGTWGAHYLAWQYHIMQLAVTEDRFSYLAPFLKPIQPKQNEWK